MQITNEWKAPGNSAILGRNQYVALNLSANSAKSKKPLSPYQKPCKHMSEAIVVDGTERGRIAKVCAEPNCRVHFADRRAPNPAQTAKEREQRRKDLERQKVEATVRHRTLAEVLKRIGAPLDRADLALVASALLNKLEPLRRELLARRHKLIEGPASEVTHPQVQQGIARLLWQPDEGALSKLLIEVVLLECTDRAPTSDPDVLIATAKRHRVDVDKLRKAVEQEFTAKRAKQEAKQTKAAKKAEERDRHAVEKRIHDARLPRMKTLEEFDFNQAPQIPAAKIRELAEGGYIGRAEPVVLMGECGTGKTHLATGLCVAACRQKRRVRFTTAANLVNELVEAQQHNGVRRVLARWMRYDVIALDEVGYVPLAEIGAEFLFQVIAERAERASMIVTTNLPFSEWTQVFPNPRLCKALLDRITDRAHIIETGTDSYRFRRTLEVRNKKKVARSGGSVVVTASATT